MTSTTRRGFIATTLAATAVFQASGAFAAASEHQVEIKNFAFEPANLQVRVGDTVTFTNSDGAPHTATARNKSFDTKTLGKNKSATITVTAEMAGEYFCKIHPSMKAMIEVVS